MDLGLGISGVVNKLSSLIAIAKFNKSSSVEANKDKGENCKKTTKKKNTAIRNKVKSIMHASSQVFIFPHSPYSDVEPPIKKRKKRRRRWKSRTTIPKRDRKFFRTL